jgi:hypothetical protein
MHSDRWGWGEPVNRIVAGVMFQSMTRPEETVRARLIVDGSGVVLNPRPLGDEPFVTVHQWDDTTVIVACPGWTQEQWEQEVPADMQVLSPGAWNYRHVHGHDVWALTLQPDEV